MGYIWDWHIFLQAASTKETYFDWLVAGLWTTFKIGVLAWLLAFSLGSVLGIMRTVPQRVPRLVATAYVDLFRNIPLIVQLFLWYYLMPKYLPTSARAWLFAQPPATSAFITATLGLGFFTAARICEQVRAGIDSVPGNLKQACFSLGFTVPQAYRYVLLPVSYRLILPPLTSEMLSIFKNSSIAGTVGVLELFARSRQLNDYTAHPYESFIAVVVGYLLINAMVMLLMRRLEHHVRMPGMIGAR